MIVLNSPSNRLGRPLDAGAGAHRSCCWSIATFGCSPTRSTAGSFLMAGMAHSIATLPGHGGAHGDLRWLSPRPIPMTRLAPGYGMHAGGAGREGRAADHPLHRLRGRPSTNSPGSAALTGPQDRVAEVLAEYQRRARSAGGRPKRHPGPALHTPQGAFYTSERPRPSGETVRLDHGISAQRSGVANPPRHAFGRMARDISASVSPKLHRKHSASG